MGNFIKWIGGGLGWALGGQIGAIIGYAIGSLFDGGSTKTTTHKTQTYSRQTNESNFKASLLVMMACVMKADGKVQKSELDVVKRF